MDIYSIGLASDCPLDEDFFSLIEKIAHKNNLSTYLIHPFNLQETLFLLQNGQIGFLALYDRASDTSTPFRQLYSLLQGDKIYYFADLDKQKRAADKSIMHTLFNRNKINVPATFILPEYATQQTLNLSEKDLAGVSRPFVIKPSTQTGAGSGVFLNAYTLQDVQEKRKEFPQDKYLVQEKIYPKEIYLKRSS